MLAWDFWITVRTGENRGVEWETWRSKNLARSGDLARTKASHSGDRREQRDLVGDLKVKYLAR